MRKYIPAAFATLACVAYDPDATAADPKRALLLLFAIVCASLPLSQFDWRMRPPLRLGAVFLGLSAISVLWGRWSGVLDLATWCGAATLGWAAARGGEVDARASARIVAMFVGAIVSAWALLAFAMGHRGFGVHAGQGNPNWLGLLLAIALPLSLDWSPRQGRPLKMAVVAIQVPAIFVSHSRVGWAAAAISVLLVVSVAAYARRREAALMLLALGIGCGIALGIAASDRAAATKIVTAKELLDAPDRQVEATPLRSLEGRIWIWRNSIDAARENLPFGVGLGGFGHAYLDAQGKRLGELSPRSAARQFVNATTAHQDYLQVSVESGPLTLLVLAACLASALVALFRARWVSGAAAILAFALCMLGDSPMRHPAPCVLICLVLFGLPKGDGAPDGKWSIWLTVCARLSLAGLLAMSTECWMASRALTSAERADPASRVRLLSRATSLAPWSGEAHLARGLHLLGQGQLHESAICLTKADRHLANVGTKTAIGELRLAEGSPVAVDAFRSALAWHPGSLRARMGLAEAYRRCGKLASAEEQARVAVSLAPGESRAIDLLESILADLIDAE